MARKVIITCAVTGAIHTPSMSKALPVTPQEIADAAVDAAEAGAAIVHLHARNPKTGQPDQSPEAFAPFLKVIKQRSNCVINLTTGGAPTMTVDERVRPAAVYKPEVASLNMGSMNFGFFGMLNRFKKFEHDWELKHVQNKDIVFRNTFQDIEFVLKTLSETGTRFEFECYDTAHLYNLDYFLQQGLVKAAAVRADRVRPAGRHRRPSRRRAAHEAHRRPPVRRQVRLVGARRWAQPTADRGDGGRHGRQHPRWPRGFAMGRARPDGGVQCGAGDLGAQDHRRPRA
jgi:hypothetical protein